MPISYSIPQVYEDEIKAMVKSGYYSRKSDELASEDIWRTARFSSKSDVVRDAIRLLFETKGHLKLSAVIDMYKDVKVTLSKAAELAGLDKISFKEILKDKEIKIEV